jgi:hypothetical protein
MAEHFDVAVIGGDAAGDGAALAVKAATAVPAAWHGQGVLPDLTIRAGLIRWGVTV